MIQQSIERLDYLCGRIPDILRQIPDDAFSHKPAPEKWSKKEIIGHLIDSAANNHQRFIRIQFENEPKITYDQEKWNLYGYYNQLDKEHVIGFWEKYNLHLLEIIKRIPPHNLNLTGLTGGDEKLSLGWLIEDYVKHMEHHLKQVVDY
jgi:hypothetical protein